MVFEKIKIFEGEKDDGIILMHGWTANPLQLYSLARKLNKKGFWIFIPLLSGHGTKPEDLEGVGWKDWNNDIIEAIDFVKNKFSFKNIFIGGISMGGNLCLLASTKRKVDGIFLLGTPVHIKNHFWIWLASRFDIFYKKFIYKTFPKKAEAVIPKNHSYSFFPACSVKESLEIIRKSAMKLHKVTAPILIIQTNSDYLVAKYSPWIIYNRVKSEIKKLQWIQSKYESHTLTKEETNDFFNVIYNFIQEIKNNKN